MDSPKRKGKVKQVSVDTRQPVTQLREAKHYAVTQMMAVMIAFTPVLSASFLSEIIPRETPIIQQNTFAFSSLLSQLTFNSPPSLAVSCFINTSFLLGDDNLK